MRSWITILLFVLMSLALCACNSSSDQGDEGETTVTELTTFEQKASYALGVDVANTVGRYPFDYNQDGLVGGIRDVLAEGTPELSDEQKETHMGAFREKMMNLDQSNPDAPSEALDREVCYALGMDIGSSMRQIPADIDHAVLMQGFTDQLNGAEMLMTPEESQQVMGEFNQQMAGAEQERRAVQGEANITEGAAFLTANKAKDGVVETESGLQYKVLTEGDGPHPSATDKVKVHYQGTLLDGTEFDSSYSRGEPISFSLDGVIAGWTEGVQLMSVGSKYEFYIPSNLAYGERGAGRDIGPNATLIFVIELLAIEK
ncbi:MAG: FKBP-type peptidyl-prolyl cis-trans isomerase [bacterium]